MDFIYDLSGKKGNAKDGWNQPIPCKFCDLFDDGIEKACLILLVYFSFKSMVSGICFPPDKDRDVLKSNWTCKSNVLVAERLNNYMSKKQR